MIDPSFISSIERGDIPAVQNSAEHGPRPKLDEILFDQLLGGTTHMVDYLQPVSRAWRITSIVGCTVTSVICLLLSLLLWTDMIRRHSFHYQGKPLWIAAAVVAVIGLSATFIAWRLVRRHAAANGVTVMPIWFIQLFGVFLLLGLCFVAYHRGNVLFMVGGVSLCVAMILVGRHIGKRQRV